MRGRHADVRRESVDCVIFKCSHRLAPTNGSDAKMQTSMYVLCAFTKVLRAMHPQPAGLRVSGS